MEGYSPPSVGSEAGSVLVSSVNPTVSAALGVEYPENTRPLAKMEVAGVSCSRQETRLPDQTHMWSS